MSGIWILHSPFRSLLVNKIQFHMISSFQPRYRMVFSAEKPEESKMVPSGSSISNVAALVCSCFLLSLNSQRDAVGILHSSAPCTSFLRTKSLEVAHSLEFLIISLRQQVRCRFKMIDQYMGQGCDELIGKTNVYCRTRYGVHPSCCKDTSVCHPPRVRLISSWTWIFLTCASMASNEPSRLRISASSFPQTVAVHFV